MNELDPDSIRWLPLRDGERFSHSTAALLYGLPLPAGVGTELHVTTSLTRSQARRREVVGHRDDGRALAHLGTTPVSTPERTFIELGTMLGVDDLVAVGDHLVHSPRRRAEGRPWTTMERLAEACRSAQWGVTTARRALPWIRPGVESPKETELRLLLLRAGLPEPVCGYEVVDGGGSWIGWFDLAWPELHVLGEYDGDQHRTSTLQYEKDIRRFDLATAAGWRVVRVRSAGLVRSGRLETVRRFRYALAGGAR